jgi:hypothetical protein
MSETFYVADHQVSKTAPTGINQLIKFIIKHISLSKKRIDR